MGIYMSPFAYKYFSYFILVMILSLSVLGFHFFTTSGDFDIKIAFHFFTTSRDFIIKLSERHYSENITKRTSGRYGFVL